MRARSASSCGDRHDASSRARGGSPRHVKALAELDALHASTPAQLGCSSSAPRSVAPSSVPHRLHGTRVVKAKMQKIRTTSGVGEQGGQEGQPQQPSNNEGVRKGGERSWMEDAHGLSGGGSNSDKRSPTLISLHPPLS
jgi:hypothetical protein